MKKLREEPRMLAGARGTLVGIIVFLFSAASFLRITEGWSMLDSIYFAVATATTVGYVSIRTLVQEVVCATT